MYCQFTDSLHDGHMALQIKNLHTGNYITIMPGYERVMRERGQTYRDEDANLTDLGAYLTGTLPAQYGIKDYDETGSAALTLDLLKTNILRIVPACSAYIALVDANGGPDATNDSIYAAVGRLQISLVNLASIIMMSSKPELYPQNKVCHCFHCFPIYLP